MLSLCGRPRYPQRGASVPCWSEVELHSHPVQPLLCLLPCTTDTRRGPGPRVNSAQGCSEGPLSGCSRASQLHPQVRRTWEPTFSSLLPCVVGILSSVLPTACEGGLLFALDAQSLSVICTRSPSWGLAAPGFGSKGALLPPPPSQYRTVAPGAPSTGGVC